MPRWAVKPPLEEMDEKMLEEVLKEFSKIS